MKTLSADDLREVERFREYLDDLYSSMPPDDFASKWADYLDVTMAVAKKYKAKFYRAAPVLLPTELPKFPGVTTPFKNEKGD